MVNASKRRFLCTQCVPARWTLDGVPISGNAEVINMWSVNVLEGTATGPAIYVGDHEVAVYWSDEDGVMVTLDGDMMTPDAARDLAAALRQMADHLPPHM